MAARETGLDGASAQRGEHRDGWSTIRVQGHDRARRELLPLTMSAGCAAVTCDQIVSTAIQRLSRQCGPVRESVGSGAEDVVPDFFDAATRKALLVVPFLEAWRRAGRRGRPASL